MTMLYEPCIIEADPDTLIVTVSLLNAFTRTGFLESLTELNPQAASSTISVRVNDSKGIQARLGVGSGQVGSGRVAAGRGGAVLGKRVSGKMLPETMLAKNTCAFSRYKFHKSKDDTVTFYFQNLNLWLE